MIEDKDDALVVEEQDELFEHFRIVVDKGQSLVRIDKFLFGRLENTSRNKVQAAIDANNVLVNGKTVKSSYKVKPLDVISIVLAHPPREIELYADDIPINIIYEDDTLVVVDKPVGMVVHPAYGNYRNTLVNAMLCHFHPELKDQVIKSDSIRPGLVHRIDKNTSGLLVIAKTEYALSHLAKQFFERTSQRKYIALVWGDFDNAEGTVTGNVGRNIANRKMMDVFPNGEYGKHAVTHYKVLEKFLYTTLIECKLETGRTHQIRVHMKYIKHPLFNDFEYGGDAILRGTAFTRYKQFVQNCFALLPGQALHAATLGFVHPVTKKEMFFESPLPENFNTLIEKWRGYSRTYEE